MRACTRSAEARCSEAERRQWRGYHGGRSADATRNGNNELITYTYEIRVKGVGRFNRAHGCVELIRDLKDCRA